MIVTIPAPDQGDVVKIDVTALDKEGRQKVHQCVRSFWPHLVTSTVDGDK